MSHRQDRGGDTEHELRAIRDLATAMPDREGLLIYPEGTRYSEEKRVKFTNKVAQRGGEIGAIASSYRRVLPPRPAGTLAILEARAELLPRAPAAGDVGSWLDGFLFSMAGPIYAGTNEIQRNVIAERLLGLPRA